MAIREEVTAAEVAAMLGWTRQAVIRALDFRGISSKAIQ
jgi:hypothetical protein